MPKPDWKWMIIGILAALFGWPFVQRMLAGRRQPAAA
jgi:hypothetical protein